MEDDQGSFGVVLRESRTGENVLIYDNEVYQATNEANQVNKMVFRPFLFDGLKRVEIQLEGQTPSLSTLLLLK